MNAHLLMPLVMVPLILFAIWRRVRSQFGRQPIRRQRMLVRIGIFGLVALMLASSGLHDPRLLLGLLAGVLAGAALGRVGLGLTRFELDPVKGDCYIPNPWIGGLLTALLIGRLIWRLLTALPAAAHDQLVVRHAPPLGDSPLTLAVIGLTVGYYIAYFIGLLLHHRRLLASRPDIVAD